MVDKVLKILRVFVYPLLYVISQYIFLFIIAAIFFLINSNGDIKVFLKDNIPLLIFNVFIILFLARKYDKYKKEYKKAIDLKTVIKIIMLGIFVSFILNMAILYIKSMLNIEIVKSLNLYLLISTGIVGPILEEYLFRGIVYNKLLEFNNEKNAALISVIIFSLFHANLFSFIYAFIVGYFLIKLYQKYNTLKAPIIFHITINTFISIIMFLI